MLVIGLNPSTADQSKDDPTIRRCVGFAKSLGYSGLLMANLFGFRSTQPEFLRACADPIGPENDEWLKNLHSQAALTVAAWGNWGQLFDRGSHVRARLSSLHCFGVTSKGEPKHPLYLAASTRLVSLT